MWTYYVGAAGQRVELYALESAESGDDVHTHLQRRFSTDYGRTWTELEDRDGRAFMVGDAHVQPRRLERLFYDRHADVVLCVSDQCIRWRNKWYHHAYESISYDGARTFSACRMLRYESGPAMDCVAPCMDGRLDRNHAYPGNNTIRHSNGTIIHVLTEVAVEVPSRSGTLPIGSRCMIGRWNPISRRYDWIAGSTISVPLEISSRGLMEAEAAELIDGRLLVIWRSNGGAKLFSVSHDGGLTLTPPRPLRYDDCSPCYSPSSISHMLRHSRTGMLYWFGNICHSRPIGNMPRDHLVVAEIDESSVSLKKNTLHIIASRQVTEPETIQFSNFSLFENGDTQNIELYVTPLGIKPDSFEAPVRRYVVSCT